MKILSLRASGIAGQSFDHQLGPVTVITGKNTKGKTTRLNALVFNLAGYVPGLPKTNSGLFTELATGSKLNVETILQDQNGENYGVCRSLESIRGAIKAEYQGSLELAIPPVMIDAGEFTNLSERERVKYIFARTSGNADRNKVCAAILANLKNIKLDPHTADAEKVIGELVAEISEYVSSNNRTVQDLVDDICADLTQKKKDADAGVKRLVKAQEALTQTAGDEQPPAANCESELAARQTVMNQVNTDIGRHNQAVRSIGLEKTEALAAQLKLSTEEGQQAELAALQALLAKGRGELGDKPVEPSLTQYQKICEELDRCTTRYNITFKQWNDQDRVVRQLEQDLKSLDDPAAAKCTKCGSDLSKTRESLLLTCKSQLAAALLLVMPLEAVCNVANAEMVRVTGLKHAEMESYQTAGRAVQAWQQKANNLVALERRIATAQGELAKNNELRAKVEKLPDIESRLTNAGEELAAVKATGQQLSTEITGLQAQVRRLHQLRGKAQERAKIEAEAIAQQVQLDVLKQAVTMMDELRSTLVAAAITPLLTTLNRFSAGMLPRPLTYKDGRIGCEVNGSFVEKTLSGAEKAVALGAISVALAAESPLKILILDELTRLDLDNKARFVERMLELVREGVLDQVILTDTYSTPFEKQAICPGGFEMVPRWSEPEFKLIKL